MTLVQHCPQWLIVALAVVLGATLGTALFMLWAMVLTHFLGG